jgi:hypothetical protein
LKGILDVIKDRDVEDEKVGKLLEIEFCEWLDQNEFLIERNVWKREWNEICI